jgi:transcriptional regulator with XRE-family HTH domain
MRKNNQPSTIFDSKPSSAQFLRKRGEGPNDIDIHVGNRLRLRRTVLGLSQEWVGDAVNITFQQLQKYERGINRISASRLYTLAQALGVPVSFFFEDMALTNVQEVPQNSPAPGTLPQGQWPRESTELLRAYQGIPSTRVRRRAFELLRALALPAAAP